MHGCGESRVQASVASSFLKHLQPHRLRTRSTPHPLPPLHLLVLKLPGAKC